MKPGVPWSVKGIDAEAREAAKEAARRSGQTLGQWLNSVILDQEQPQQEPQPRYRSPARPAERPSARHETATRRHRQDSDVDLQLRMDELASQLSGLTRRNQETAVSRFSSPRIEAYEDRSAMHAILDRIEQNERRQSAAMEAVNERLASLNGKLSEQSETTETLARAVASDDAGPRFDTLEEALRNIVGHIESSEKQTYDTLVGLQGRMSDMAQQASRAENDRVNARAPQIASLEKRMQELTGRLERVQNESQLAARDYMEGRLSKFSQQMDAVRHSAETVTAQTRAIAEQSARQEIEQAEHRLQNYIAQATQEAAEPFVQQIHGEIDQVNQRVEDIRSQCATDQDVRSLHGAISQLSERVAAGPDLSPLADMEGRLAELSHRLEMSQNDSGVAPQVAELEQRVQQLDQKLRSALQQQPDPESLGLLEQQIASVGDRLGETEMRLAHLSTIENSVAQLYDSIEQNRTWAGEAAEAAAQRMADQIMAGGGVAAQGTGPSPELTALEQGLEAVRASAEGADQRTQETLEAVHETLEQIINKLTELENTQSSDPAPAYQPSAGVPVDGTPTGEADSQSLEDVISRLTSQSGTEAYPQPGPQISLDGSPQLADGATGQPTVNGSGMPDLSFADETIAPQIDDVSHTGNEPAGTFDTPPEQNDDPDDFIAAARRAAQTAGGGSASQSEPGTSLLAKLRGGRKQPEPQEPVLAGSTVPAPESPASAVDKPKSSLFSLPFLNKNKAGSEAETDLEPANANAGSSGSRTRLILAGLVLLAAVSAYSFGGLNGAGEEPVDNTAIEEPRKTGAIEDAAPAKVAAVQPLNITDEDRDLVRALIDPQGKKASAAANPPASVTGMPQPSILNATAEGVAPAQPADSVSTASLPPAFDSSRAIGPRVASTDSAGVQPEIPPETFATPLPPAETGTKSLRTAAANGDPNAQFVIASRYLDGKIVGRDFKLAAEWYQRAADQGSAPALYRLGTLYERGRGVAKDVARARALYEKAAEAGNVKAMHNLAVIYANAEGSETDFTKAGKWFEAAAKHGLRDSQYNLAVLKERGLGVTQSSPDAYFWFGLAARQGDADAGTKRSTLKNFLTTSVAKDLDGKVQSWKPAKPDRKGNFVEIASKDWDIAGKKSGNNKAAATSGPDLSGKALIMKTQELLTKLGYDVGKPDGIMGSRTANAIRLYQLQSGMNVNGTPSNILVRHLESRNG